MQWDGRPISQSLVLGVALCAVAAGCIPFMGGENREESTPTPVATEPIVQPSPTPVAEPPTPQVEETIHVVKAGDTVSELAATYGVTMQAIIDANSLENPNNLSIGQELIIPPPPAQEPTPITKGPSMVQTPVPKD